MWHTLVLLLISSATTSACDTDALYQIALRDVQHRHVDVVQDASGQRKLVARKALRRGQVALSVPTSACINLGLAPAAEAALRIVRELAKGPRSRWAAYLACLPHDVHNIDTADPQLWHNTPWRRAVETQQALTTQVWEGGAPGVPAPSRLWPGIDLHAYQWAVAMVTTRALGVVGGTKLLVPVVDMANHEAGSPHVVDRDGDAVVLRIGADVPAGSEIRISYGDTLAMDELALFYGFVPDSVGKLCAVHREHPGALLRGLGTRGGTHVAEEDVTQGSPYLVAREVGRLIDLLETAPPIPAGGVPARLTQACTRLLEAEKRRLERFLDEL